MIEILIVVSLIAIFMTIVVLGFYGTSSARLRQGSTRVAGAVRVAYSYSTASSKVCRLVFDFSKQSVTLEETKDRHTLKQGGDAASEAKELAQDAADASSLRAPPSTFTEVDLRKASGMKMEDEEPENDQSEHPEYKVFLPNGIEFWQIDVEHQDEAIHEGQAFLYFFPGGQTENASVQLRVANTAEDSKTGFLSILVSPLTGKARILTGRIDAPKPKDESEASEAEDPGK